MKAFLKATLAIALLAGFSTQAQAGPILSSLLTVPGLNVLQDNSSSTAFTSTGGAHDPNASIGVGDIVVGVLRITQSNTNGVTLAANQQLSILFSAQVTGVTNGPTTSLYTLGATPASSGLSIDQLLSGGTSQFATGTFSSKTIFAVLESSGNSNNVSQNSLTTNLAAFKSAATYMLDFTGGLVNTGATDTNFFEATLKNLGTATGPTPNQLLGKNTSGMNLPGQPDGTTGLGTDSGGFATILNPAGVNLTPDGVTASHEDGITTALADLGFSASLTRVDPPAEANGYVFRDNTFISLNLASTTAVPEPSSMVLFSLALAGMGAAALRRRKKAASV
jgi:hypothetical protein